MRIMKKAFVTALLLGILSFGTAARAHAGIGNDAPINSPSAVALYQTEIEVLNSEFGFDSSELDTSVHSVFTAADLHLCGTAQDWIANEGYTQNAGDIERVAHLTRIGDTLYLVCGGV